MAGIAIADRKLWSPGPSATIDPAHPLAAHLLHLVGGSGYDYAQRFMPTSYALSERGQWMTTNSVSAAGLILAPRPRNIAGGNFTVSILCRLLPSATFQNSSYCMLFGTRNGGGSTGEAAIFVDSTGAISGFDIGGGFVGGVTGSLVGTGAFTLCTLRRAGNVFSALANAVVLGTSTSTNGALDSTPMRVGGGDAYCVNGLQIRFFGTWTRYLDDHEIARLVADPFCMLRGD